MKISPVAEVVRLRTSRDKPPKSHDFGYERDPVVALKISVVAGLPTEPLHSDRRSPRTVPAQGFQNSSLLSRTSVFSWQSLAYQRADENRQSIPVMTRPFRHGLSCR